MKTSLEETLELLQKAIARTSPTDSPRVWDLLLIVCDEVERQLDEDKCRVKALENT